MSPTVLTRGNSARRIPTPIQYPGLTFAQFLTYYNDRAGIYMACNDNSGGIKLIKPVHNRVGGIRLGFAHVGDWPANGERDLGYDVVLPHVQGRLVRGGGASIASGA